MLLAACSAPVPAVLPRSSGRALPPKASGAGALAGNLVGDRGAGVLSNNGAALITNNGAGLGGVERVGVVAFEVADTMLRRAPGTELTGTLVTTRRPVTLTWVGSNGAPLTWGPDVAESDSQPPALSTSADTQGAFRFSNLTVISPTLLQATWEDTSRPESANEGLHFLVLPGNGPLRLLEADGALGTYVLTRLIFSYRHPEAALGALTADLLAPARQALTQAWVEEPSVRDFTQASLVATIDSWLQRHPALVEALDAIRRTTLRAAQAALGAGKVATETHLPHIHGLAAGPGGRVIIVNSATQMVWGTTSRGVLEPVLGTGQQPGSLPAQGLPAAEVALAPLGPVAADAAGSVVAVVNTAPSGNEVAVVQRDAQGALRVLATWPRAALASETPVAVEVGADRRLTVWTDSASGGQGFEAGGPWGQPGPSEEAPTTKPWTSDQESEAPTSTSASLWRLTQVSSAPTTIALRAWRWNLPPTGPATTGPLRGEQVVTPVGAPPGSTFTWRLSNGVFEQVGLDGKVLGVGGRLPSPHTAATQWCGTPDGAVLVSIGEAVYRLQGGSATRVAGVAPSRVTSGENGTTGVTSGENGTTGVASGENGATGGGLLSEAP
jgi:hypothetical protein